MTTNQQRLEEIQQRLEILAELNLKLDKIIELLGSPKENVEKCKEPLITFTKPNNVENTFIEDRQRELFNSLDRKEVK